MTPPHGSTLPVMVQRVQVLETSDELDFVFSDPLIISGKIISPLDSMPLENVIIRAFTLMKVPPKMDFHQFINGLEMDSRISLVTLTL